MSVSTLAPDVRQPAKRAERTPTGLQSRATLARRRTLMLALNLATYAALAAAVARVLGAGGWTVLDVGLFVCVLVSAPWTILGFWNALVGLWLLRVAADPIGRVAPFWRDLDAAEPIVGRVAVLLAIRNEDPERAFQRLVAMRASLEATGEGRAFDMFVLSDTNLPDVAAREEALFEANRAVLDGSGRAVYRRRLDNTAWKAGNIRDFLVRWGDDYEIMIPLDADSMMSGAAMLRLARVMQRHPRLGILQSLAVGAPATSPFARLFQFGMRHGMRSFTMGSAWWQGDCGPYWGHNAAVRVAPFKAHCELPVLPGAAPLGGHILSHDQVEAALMRRAGFEVRVAPVEGESWEENPVSVVDFIKREQRWCNGNMQYWPLLALPRLEHASRFQLFQAIMMYLGSPAWMAMTAMAAIKPFESDVVLFDATLAVSLFFLMFAMSLAPKVAGAIDVALEPGGMARYGGPARFAKSVALETLFGMLMAPAVAFRLSVFLIGLAFGRKFGWAAQVRDAYGLSWADAARALWPQTLFGATLALILAFGAPQALPWAAPVLIGLVGAIPFAVATAAPVVGLRLRDAGVALIPEEIRPAPALEAVRAVSLAPIPERRAA